MCFEESVHIVFDEESAMTNHDLQDDEELSRTSKNATIDSNEDSGDTIKMGQGEAGKNGNEEHNEPEIKGYK
ncbi:hypothetical protein KY285_007773 [Solanum tuberosum]|nr:hypothetical protein KY285_007773 [Solanum tuberosum]